MGNYQGTVNGLLRIETMVNLAWYIPIPPNGFDTYVFQFFWSAIYLKNNSASCQLIIISCFILRKYLLQPYIQVPVDVLYATLPDSLGYTFSSLD